MFELLSSINRYLTKGFIKYNDKDKINVLVDYSYEDADSFDFKVPVSTKDRKFWTGISYKVKDREYILHTKTNLLFHKNGDIIGRIFTEFNDMDKTVSYVPLSQLENSEDIIKWLEGCGYVTKISEVSIEVN